ncbi:MAG: hypothetical protein IJL78_07555 [Lachnospiraceae bacterium]|nr:hypothetical protein [Lachnospiraceae bacterium]
MNDTKILAGIAKVDISPTMEQIAAYRTLHKEQFRDVKHRLYARILALRDEETGRTALIVGSDLINVPDYFMIRERLSEAYGIKPTDMILGGTQNHSSIVSDPPDIPTDARPDFLLAVRDCIHDQIFAGVGQALAGLKPAKIGWGTVPSIIGINKDMTVVNGVPMGANTNMYEENELFILLVRDLSDKPMAAMLNYGMQGVFYSTMVDSHISGDIHGAVSAKLEEFYGEGFIAPYLIDASGDRSPLINGDLQSFHVVDGTLRQEKVPLPEEAQDRLLDWLSGLQANDAVALIRNIDCSTEKLALRSGEIFREGVTRVPPHVSGGGKENDLTPTGTKKHRLHFVALTNDLVFACGDSITQSDIGRLVKNCLPVKTVYISVEGGVTGYVVARTTREETFGYRFCPFLDAEESERIYTESIQKLYKEAE